MIHPIDKLDRLDSNSIEAIYPSDIPLCGSPLDLTKAFENKDVSAFTITYSDVNGQITDPSTSTNGAVDRYKCSVTK